MTPFGFTILFISALIIETGWDIFLTKKNIAWIKERAGFVPSYLAGKTSREELQQASEYGAVKGRIAIVEGVYHLALLLIVIVFGLIGSLDTFFAGFDNLSVRMSLFFVSIMIIPQAFALPFALYNTFVVEERFGFNKMTLRLFFVDMLKGAAVTGLLVIPLLLGVTWFISNYSLWWLYSWLFLFSFSLFMMWIYPTLIAPLFNKFYPLPEGGLAGALDDLARRCNFSFKEVKVMDAGKRSGHSNAYFTGFGKVKRIVLFDTLLNQLSEKEVISVLAHELGHFKMKHILKTLAISQASLLAGFYFMSRIIDYEWIYRGLGMHKNPWSALLCFLLLLPRAGFWLAPVSGWFSRRNEFEADAYAKSVMGTGEHLQTALITLQKENLSSPEPHPLYKKWHYSHPPVGERVERLKLETGNWKLETGNTVHG